MHTCIDVSINMFCCVGVFDAAVSTGTFVQEGEGCLEVAWSLRNFADNAEQVCVGV